MNEMKLKFSVIIVCIAILLLPLGCAPLDFTSNSFAKGDAPKEIETERKSDREQIKALRPEDPRRQKVMTLTWQIQYQREKLKFLEMKYLGACYQDKEYRDAMIAIESLNKQIRQLILL